MPRIVTSRGENKDFCRRHFPGETNALVLFGMQGGSDFQHDAVHDGYSPTEDTCYVCQTPLTRRDDYDDE